MYWEEQEACKKLGAPYVQEGWWSQYNEWHWPRQVFYILGGAHDQKRQVTAAWRQAVVGLEREEEVLREQMVHLADQEPSHLPGCCATPTSGSARRHVV